MKKFFSVASLALILCLSGSINGQTVSETPASTISEQQLELLEQTVAKLTTSLDQLRELANDGLVPTNELEETEKDVAETQSKIAEFKTRIKTERRLTREQQNAANLVKVKPLVKPVLKSINMTGATVMRSTTGVWSLKNVDKVQQFFVQSFGRELPITTFGQSSTHNRLHWNHRNSVDIGVHPDSPEGRALMTYLQESNIPFLAFRAAIPGVATGPHIHIGFPSQRMA